MKLWLPLALLLVLFALASLWHSRRRAELRAEGLRSWEPAADVTLASEPGADPGWSHLLVGRPSGAAPLDPIEEPTLLPTAPAANMAQPDAPGLATHVVARGESLSVICQRHYGTARPSVVRALARSNGLEDPNDLRAGHRLELPPLEALTR